MHAVAASVTYGCSLGSMRLQPWSHPQVPSTAETRLDPEKATKAEGPAGDLLDDWMRQRTAADPVRYATS